MNDQEHKCQCDFRIRMLGDGCRYCQPQKYIDRLHDTIEALKKLVHQRFDDGKRLGIIETEDRLRKASEK